MINTQTTEKVEFTKKDSRPHSNSSDLEKIFLFEVGITNQTEDNILEYIVQKIEKDNEKFYIVTPNPEILVYATKNKDFKNILNNAKIALPDGVGVTIAAGILGKGVIQRITGTDFVEKLCSAVSKKPITVGFLGGWGKVAEQAADCLFKKYPGLNVVFAASEWNNSDRILSHVANDTRRALGGSSTFSSSSLSERRSTKTKDNSSVKNGSTFSSFTSGQASIANNLTMKQFNNETIDILFVAFGFPKQEEWIAQSLDKIPVRVAIGVGGAFDFISGKVSRAPLWVRLAGFEWLYRLIRQPWRWRRQLALLEFGYMVFKERLKSPK